MNKKILVKFFLNNSFLDTPLLKYLFLTLRTNFCEINYTEMTGEGLALLVASLTIGSLHGVSGHKVGGDI